MKALDTINSILKLCGSDRSLLPPTVLFNEGWMLRLLLEWFSGRKETGHPLDFTKGARWYSEALLRSPFLARKKGDKLAESWTHADGVIGHFEIGGERKSGAALNLHPDATTFKVLEAKMNSPLSMSVKNATYYNQAARYIACIAKTLEKACKHPSEMMISFYVIAPKTQIDAGTFAKKIKKDDIEKNVKRRLDEYESENQTDKQEWFQSWFLPILQKIDIKAISWEILLEHVKKVDPETGSDLDGFYKECLRFNKVNNKRR